MIYQLILGPKNNMSLKALLILWVICKVSFECQNVDYYPKLFLDNPGDSHVYIHRNEVFLEDSHKIFTIDPITLNKTLLKFSNRTFKNTPQIVRTRNSCIYADSFSLCGFNVTLLGCPTFMRDETAEFNPECSENMPIVYWNDDLSKSNKKIGYRLICHSSKFHLKQPFDELHFMVSVDSETFYMLASTLIPDGPRITGVCEFSLRSITTAFKDDNTMVNVHTKNDGWIKMSMKNFMASNFIEGFILNHYPKQTLFDVVDKSITAFNVTHFKNFDNKTYPMFYYATSDRKVSKAIVGNSLQEVHDLYCNFDSGVSQLLVWDSQKPVIRTQKRVYFPLPYVCNASATCSECLKTKDPHCFWREDLGYCDGVTHFDGIKDLSYYKQDVLNKNVDAMCSKEPKEQDIINKLALIQKLLNDEKSKKLPSSEEELKKINRRLEVIEKDVKDLKNCSKSDFMKILSENTRVPNTTFNNGYLKDEVKFSTMQIEPYTFYSVILAVLVLGLLVGCLCCPTEICTNLRKRIFELFEGIGQWMGSIIGRMSQLSRGPETPSDNDALNFLRRMNDPEKVSVNSDIMNGMSGRTNGTRRSSRTQPSRLLAHENNFDLGLLAEEAEQ